MSSTTSPLISVIVPTCHRNDLLAKCLDCLAPGVQTLPPEQYEVIVTDDGSRSTAQQLVQDKYPWVRWTAGPRKGPAANRNNGAFKAAGEWLAFTDDDCLPTSSWLEGYAQSLNESILVYEGKTTCKAGVQSPLYQSPINLTGGCLWSCNLMFRADLFREMQGFDSDYSFAMEDIDMRDRLQLQRHPTRFVPEAVVDHPPRRRPSGLFLGKQGESYVRHWYKFGNRGSYWSPFFRHVKHGLYCLTRFRLSWDLAVAFYVFFFEAFYIAVHLSLWQKRFRAHYQIQTHAETALF